MLNLNGFKIISLSYEKLAEQGVISAAKAEKECKIYDFLANCDEDDFFKLFDSSAFNEIVMNYVRRAVWELAEEGVLEEDQGYAVRDRVHLLFSECSAKQISHSNLELDKKITQNRDKRQSR